MNNDHWLSQLTSTVWNNWYIFISLAIVLWAIGIYNKLVRAELAVESAWADIDTILKQRFDMIPNLVEIVKGYASHESETLTKVIEVRSKAGEMNIDIKNATAEQMAAFQASQGELGQMLGKLFALSESYPDLKANENFLKLQGELSELEEKINMARRFYNGTVKIFNELMRVFPGNIVAKVFGFTEKQFFEADEDEKENVKVQF